MYLIFYIRWQSTLSLTTFLFLHAVRNIVVNPIPKETCCNFFCSKMLGLCCELNRHINGGQLHLKSFPGSKANQLHHHTIPILEKHQYDAAAIHVGIKQHL